MEEQRPKVGIGVYVLKDGKLLLGKRKASHGEGEYATPGGHLEYMESFESCALRETQEETGMEIENIKFLCLANVKDYAPKHYVHVCLTADWKDGEPKVMEPDKMEDWEWYDMDNLPQPLFKTIPIELQAYRTGKNYFDS
jgi:8-oxo-dGTP diphosphatase